MNSRTNRRAFFKTTGFGLAGTALLGGPSSANPVQRPLNVSEFRGVELAIATICTDGFGNRHHEPAFRLLPDLGYRNVEFNLWYPDTITPRYIRSIKERCQTSGLQAICLQGSAFGGADNTGMVKDVAHKLVLMEGCLELGCRRVKCTGSRRGTNGGLKAVIDVCKELAPAAEDLGALLTLENHANNVIENIADYEEIFAAIDSPNVGMCLDTGHFEGVAVDLHEVIEKFHQRILHVDLKDCQERGAGHNTVPFGEGVTDFDAFLKHLFSKNYSGYLVIEQAWSEPKGPWVENLRKARELFEPYLQPLRQIHQQ
jgi:sugar phosphate isomerase/epimerase